MALIIPSLPKRKWAVPFLLVVVIAMVPWASADYELLRSMCMESSLRDLCLATMAADPHALACENRPCGAHVSVEHAIRNVSDTRNRIRFLIDGHLPPIIDQALRICSDEYANVMAHLDQVLQLLEAKNYAGADETMVEVVKQADHCEAAFPTHPSPVEDLNKACEDMIQVASDLVRYAV